MTLGPKLGVPGVVPVPVIVNCSQVLAAARLAISVPPMLRSADTHWLFDTAWNDTVPLLLFTRWNFSVVPIAVLDAINRPPLLASTVTNWLLIDACSDVVPSRFVTPWNSSQVLAAVRLAIRKLAPAFSADTKSLLAAATRFAACAVALASTPNSTHDNVVFHMTGLLAEVERTDRKSTRLNSSH